VVIKRTFENMGERFLLLTVERKEPKPRAMAPFHWFLADKRKPALDLSIEPSDGMFREPTYFIDDPITPMQAPSAENFTHAMTFFETDKWVESNLYHVEQLGEARVYVSGQDLVLAFQGSRLDEAVLLDTRFGVLLDSDQRLTGFILKSLTSEEWSELRRAELM
jgi:hypothetical protein